MRGGTRVRQTCLERGRVGAGGHLPLSEARLGSSTSLVRVAGWSWVAGRAYAVLRERVQENGMSPGFKTFHGASQSTHQSAVRSQVSNIQVQCIKLKGTLLIMTLKLVSSPSPIRLSPKAGLSVCDSRLQLSLLSSLPPLSLLAPFPVETTE